MPKFKPGDEVTILNGSRAGQHGFVFGEPIVPAIGPIWYFVSFTPAHLVHDWHRYPEECLEKYEESESASQENHAVLGVDLGKGDEAVCLRNIPCISKVTKWRIRESAKYNNRWAGYTGVIAGNPYTQPNGEVSYPVRIDGIVNKDSGTGRFWYREKDLEMAALITEYRNPSPYTDYSDILGKTPAELGVSKEMLLLCEANKKKKEEKEMVVFETIQDAEKWAKEKMTFTPDSITNVIFNPPATIVFWKDGTKTIVKCGPEDIYDEEAGLAMAISKKMFGNDGTFHKVFKKWLPEPEATDADVLMDFRWLLSKLPDPGETVHTDGRRFYSMGDILREGMMSLYFKEHGEELCLNDKEKE